MSTKERALEIFKQHLALVATNQTLFRKTVMDQMQAEFGITLPSSATLYNNAKKAHPVEGLGRAPAPPGLHKTDTNKSTAPKVVDDSECFSVIELVHDGSTDTVGRCQSFLMQGDASEKFDEKVVAWPHCKWVMIKGLGPIHGEQYALDATEGEVEIKRYPPNKP